MLHDEEPLIAHSNGVANGFSKKRKVNAGFEWRDYAITLQSLELFLNTTYKEFRNRKINFALGFCSCFLVVILLALLFTILASSPVIFLRLSELQDGEIDIVLNADKERFLNLTEISSVLANETEYLYSPRYFLPVLSYASSSCKASVDPFNVSWKYSCGGLNLSVEECFLRNGECAHNAFSAQLLLADLPQEEIMGLGHDWQHNSVSNGSALLDRSLASLLGVQVGDFVYLSVDSASFKGVFRGAGYNFTTSPEWATVILPVRVQTIFDKPLGKFSVTLSKILIMDYSSILTLLASNLNPAAPAAINTLLATANLSEYAAQVVVNYPPPRLPYYAASNYDDTLRLVTAWGSRLTYRLGFDVLECTFPVLQKLQLYSYFSLFLNLILNIIIITMLALSILLVYSLLMVNVETKTFEMGMFRMLGSSRIHIVQLLIFQGLFFSVPAILLGLLFAQLVAVPITSYMAVTTGVAIAPWLTATAVSVSVTIGLLIPIIGAVLPIRAALERNLSESIDVAHSRTKATEFKVNRAEDGGIDWAVMLLGTAFTVFGVCIDYFFPLGLVTLNLTLLGNVFMGLLIGMLLGLIMLAINVQNIVERIFVILLLFWEHAAVRALVLKNLVAHRKRNRKTSMLYASSLGFIIFISIYFQVNLASASFQLQKSHGAELTVESVGSRSPTGGREVSASQDSRGNIRVSTRTESSMGYFAIEHRTELEHVLLASPIVASFAWVSAPIASVHPDWTFTDATNAGHYYYSPVDVVATSPNFGFATASAVLEVPGHSYPQVLFDDLYSAVHRAAALVSTSLKLAVGAAEGQDILLELTGSKPAKHVPTEVLALVDGAPRLYMTKYPSIRLQNVVLSMPAWLRVANNDSEVYASVEDIPMNYLEIKFNSGKKHSELVALKTALGKVIEHDEGVYIWDYEAEAEPLNTANTAMSLLFNVTTVFAMLICFFSLVSSMYSNVHDQAKEIGVLLSVGLQKDLLRRVYVEEALLVVLSSSLLGIMSGVFISWTISIQRQLLLAMPLVFPIPYGTIVVIAIVSLICAFLSSWGPVQQMLQQPIVSVLKST